jgi:hypothetical protein
MPAPITRHPLRWTSGSGLISPSDSGIAHRHVRGVVAEEASSAGASRRAVAGSVEWIVIFDGVAHMVIAASRVAWAVGPGGVVRIVPDRATHKPVP